MVSALCAMVVFFCKDFLVLAGAFANWIKESFPVEGKALERADAS